MWGDQYIYNQSRWPNIVLSVSSFSMEDSNTSTYVSHSCSTVHHCTTKNILYANILCIVYTPILLLLWPPKNWLLCKHMVKNIKVINSGRVTPPMFIIFKAVNFQRNNWLLIKMVNITSTHQSLRCQQLLATFFVT